MGLTEMKAMKDSDLESFEIDLLLEAAYQRYGYDFRDYKKGTVKRRINGLADSTNSSSPSALIPRILHDEEVFSQLVTALSVTVTELFRDPKFYEKLRQLVLPALSTYAFFKVWHAGCATGEEAYSTAILIEEAKLSNRARIYGTDINSVSLEKAREGIFKLGTMKEGQSNYVKAGGRASFTDYYHARYNAAQMSERLSKNMTFSHHNLVSDHAFDEMNLIVCRNVLIYFNQRLKDRVLSLLADSLCHRGFLCLGTKESLEFSAVKDRFETVSRTQRIYRKL